MKNKILIKAPAKLNLFLKIINKRKDKFHNIFSGITFLDLYDNIEVQTDKIHSITYIGKFKPKNKIFKDDILLKTIKLLKLKNDIKLKIKIKKNIPTQAGLGSASTDAAALIKALINLKILKNFNTKLLSALGSDVSACFYSKDCLIYGKGDKIYKKIIFPKYYFILVKPNINFSTSKMYSKFKRLKNAKNLDYYKKYKKYINIENNSLGNDFEKIAINYDKKIFNILNFLSNLKNSCFARMSGSGSCCYVAFKKKTDATKAIRIIKKKFPNYWHYLGIK
tara:strand:- start:110 stop:949 length:840 start_codon:yes stop_codon:yes gene_type:complete